MREAARAGEVLNTTAFCIKQSAAKGNESGLNSLFDPANHRRGSLSLIAPSEEGLTIQRALVIAKGGFAIDSEGITSFLTQVSNEGR